MATFLTSCQRLRQTSKVENDQCHWRGLGVIARPDKPTTPAGLSWHNQIPTNEVIREAEEKYRVIKACARAQGHWGDRGHLLKAIASKRNIRLPVGLEPDGAARAPSPLRMLPSY